MRLRLPKFLSPRPTCAAKMGYKSGDPCLMVVREIPSVVPPKRVAELFEIEARKMTDIVPRGSEDELIKR